MTANVVKRSILVMGTGATVEIHEHPSPERAAALVEEAFDWLREVDQRFSTYKEDSEVSRLDRGSLSIDEGSDDLRFVVAECARLWQVTDGYFDAYATGRFDPSGYVKGWAVAVASARLHEAGAVNHLVDAGGDVQCRGRPVTGEAWRVGIRHPWQHDQVCGVVTGTDIAVATSGTYERGAHVLNPRTGQPALALRSVTVVGPDLGVADAYATAAMAMGPEALRWLAGLAGYESAVVTEDGTFHVSANLPLVETR